MDEAAEAMAAGESLEVSPAVVAGESLEAAEAMAVEEGAESENAYFYGIAQRRDEPMFDPTTELVRALQNGNKEEIDRIILRINGDGDCIVEMAKRGNLEILKILVENQGGDVNYVKDDGRALERAVVKGHLDIVKLFIDRNAVVYGTLLPYACQKGRTEIARYIIEHGTDDDIRAKIERQRVNAKIPRNLETLNNTNRMSALSEAAQNGHTDVVRYLLDKGAMSNNTARFYDGPTTPVPGSALIEATMKGDLEMVKYLLEKGADANYGCVASVCSSFISIQNLNRP